MWRPETPKDISDKRGNRPALPVNHNILCSGRTAPPQAAEATAAKAPHTAPPAP